MKFISKNTNKSSVARKPKQPRKQAIPRIQMGLIPIHTFNRAVSVNVQIRSTGLIPTVGVTDFTFFSIWYTPQTIFIWGNSSNYITASVAGYTDIAALFDEVMIDSMEMSIYASNLEQLPTVSNFGSAVMALCTDYNDKNAPTAIGDVLQYQDCKVIPLLSQFPYKEKVSPRLLSYTLDSAGISQPSTPIKAFVRSNLDVEHYCRKGCLLQSPSQVQQYTFLFRYTLKCRVVK